MTTAHLGIAVTDNADKAAVNLDALTASSDRAEASARKLEGTSRGAATATGHFGGEAAHAATATAQLENTVNLVAAAQGRAVASIHASTAALQANAAAARMATANARNLSFQLIDIGQGIPLMFQSPLYGLQNLGFQIAQISQLYIGNGGMKQALIDVGGQLLSFTRYLGPAALAVGAVAVGVAGLTHEINKTADVQVGFFDVVIAGWQLVSEAIVGAVMPAINQVATWFGQLWNIVAGPLKAVGNAIIGTFVGAFDAVRATWSALPAALGDIAYQTANRVIDGIEMMVNAGIDRINDLISLANNIPGVDLQGLDHIGMGDIANPHEGAMAGVADAAAGAVVGAMTTDYLGSVFDALSGRAQEVALLREEMDGLATSAGGVGGATQAANDNISTLRDSLSEFIDIEDPFTTVRDNLAGLQELLAAGEISWQQYGHASAMAMASAASATLSAVGKQTSMLASAFEDNKAFALANAVVSGLEAVVSSYAAGARIGGPILGAAFAATAAAATAAQIGAIMSAKPGSASMGASGGGGTAAAPAPVAPPEPSRTINVTLGGNGRYSRDEVRDLLDQLTGELNDGAGTKFKMAVNG